MKRRTYLIIIAISFLLAWIIDYIFKTNNRILIIVPIPLSIFIIVTIKLIKKQERTKLNSITKIILIIILIINIIFLGMITNSLITPLINYSRQRARYIMLSEESFSSSLSESNPLVFYSSRVELRERHKTDIQIGFYNPHSFHSDWLVEVIDGNGTVCRSGDSLNCYNGTITVTYRNLPFSLEKDMTVGRYVIFEANSSAVDTIASAGAASAIALFNIKICAIEDLNQSSCPKGENIIAEYKDELPIIIRR